MGSCADSTFATPAAPIARATTNALTGVNAGHPAAEDYPSVTVDPESFIVCERSGVYHFGAPPRRPFTTGSALCGACDSWPEGGQYRSGRRRPFVTDILPADRRLCERCAEIVAAEDDQAENTIQARIGRLVRRARDCGTDHLIAVVRTLQAPVVVRQAAYVVLQERGVVRAGGRS